MYILFLWVLKPFSLLKQSRENAAFNRHSSAWGTDGREHPSSGGVRWQSFLVTSWEGVGKMSNTRKEGGGKIWGGGRRWIKRGGASAASLFIREVLQTFIGCLKSQCEVLQSLFFVKCWEGPVLLLLLWISGWCCCPSSWCLRAGPEELSSQGWGKRLCLFFLLLKSFIVNKWTLLDNCCDIYVF